MHTQKNNLVHGHTHTHSPYIFHKWYHVKEELLGQFWFASNHQTLELVAVLFNEVEYGVLRQSYSMADVQSPKSFQLSTFCQLIEDLSEQKSSSLLVIIVLCQQVQ